MKYQLRNLERFLKNNNKKNLFIEEYDSHFFYETKKKPIFVDALCISVSNKFKKYWIKYY